MSKYGFDSWWGTYTYSGFAGPPDETSLLKPSMRQCVPGNFPVPSHAANIAFAEWSMIYCCDRETGCSLIVWPYEFSPLDTVSAPG